jgi:hypothetical protein
MEKRKRGEKRAEKKGAHTHERGKTGKRGTAHSKCFDSLLYVSTD